MGKEQAEEGMAAHDLIVSVHQPSKPLLAHVRDAAVPIEAWAIERVGAALDGVGLQVAIQAGRLTGCTEKGQLRVSHRDQQLHSESTDHGAPGTRASTHAEAND